MERGEAAEGFRCKMKSLGLGLELRNREMWPNDLWVNGSSHVVGPNLTQLHLLFLFVNGPN